MKSNKIAGSDQGRFLVIQLQEEGQYCYYQCHNDPYDNKARDDEELTKYTKHFKAATDLCKDKIQWDTKNPNAHPERVHMGL